MLSKCGILGDMINIFFPHNRTDWGRNPWMVYIIFKYKSYVYHFTLFCLFALNNNESKRNTLQKMLSGVQVKRELFNILRIAR